MRHWFGRTHSDWIFTPGDEHTEDDELVGYIPVLVPDSVVTFWDAETDGTQITDLLNAEGQAVTQIETDEFGNIPRFQGPDGVTLLWASASEDGSELRYQMTPTDLGEQLNEVDARSDLNQGRLDDLEDPEGLFPGVHDVTRYGATGDGSTDDTSAIQDALDAARDAGGGTVLVPPASYSLQDLPLRIYSGTRLTAHGATFQRDSAVRMLVNGDDDQDLGGYTGHGNLLIEGGTWDGRGPEVTDYDNLFSLGHAENITIRDVTFTDVPGYHAIEVNSSKTVRVERCRFLGLYQTGNRDFTEAIQLDLAKGSAYFGAFGPYDDTPVYDAVIRDCYFGASGTSGTAAWSRGIGSHSSTIGVWHEHIRITGCHFEGLSQWAVGAYNWRYVSLAGNTIDACGGGLWVRTVDSSDTNDTVDTDGNQTSASQDIDGVAITGTTVTALTGHGESIFLEGEDTGRIRHATVTANTVDGVATENGLRTEYLSASTIGNNSVHDCAGTGISTLVLTHVLIHGNLIDTPDNSGITVDNRNGGQHASIVANRVSDAGNNGIHLLGTIDTELLENILVGSSRTTDLAGYGIRISSSASDLLIHGNKVRRRGSGNEAAYGLSITSSCSQVRRGDNDLTDSGSTGELDDNTTDRWSDVAFENSWSNFSPWQTAQYRKDLSGRVWIRGTIDGGTAGDTAFTLPSEFRPPADFVVACISSGGTPPSLCRLQINADGTVVPQDDVDSFVALDASFDTA